MVMRKNRRLVVGGRVALSRLDGSRTSFRGGRAGVLFIASLVLGGCSEELPSVDPRYQQDARQCADGDMTSCENLGDILRFGMKGEANVDKANTFYARTRELASSYCESGPEGIHGCSVLGRLYYEGKGISRDRVTGEALLRRGCAGGDNLACIYLDNQQGQLDSNGLGEMDALQGYGAKAAAAEKRVRQQLRER